jgi:uncharacterized protein (TIGR03067 family)
MRALLGCGLVVLLAGSVAAGGNGKKDLDKLQGKWAAELDGKKVELDLAKDRFTLTFSDGDKEIKFKGAVALDAAKKPRHIDLTVEDGPKFIGETAHGIYELDGDTLKWHARQPGKEGRPSEFPATPGEMGGDLYLIFKRAK